MRSIALRSVPFLLAFASLALAGARFAPGQIAYVERSSGLQVPDMEGGNTEIELADVNGDGHPDLVSIGDHGSPYINASEHGVMVWLGDGAGSWSLLQSGDFGYGGVAVGDLNDDGLADVAYGMHHNYAGGDFGDQLLEAALGDGTGSGWTPWDDGLASQGETWGMFGTDLADVDGDGDLDLGSVSFGCCNGVHVYLNGGDGTWSESFAVTGGNSNLLFCFGDVDGDGRIDLAAAHDAGTVYLGDGQGGFVPGDGDLPGPSLRRGISLGDVNGDGRDDLAFATSGGGLQVWTRVAPGHWEDLSGNLPSSGGFTLTQIADMDLDGLGDVAAFDPGSPGLIAIYSGDGSGNWRLAASVQTPNNRDSAAFRAGTDADHNGYPDLVVVQEEHVGGFPVSWRNRPRFFAEASLPASTWIHPLSPRGGETFRAGSVRFLEWTAAVPAPAGDTISIELSLDGPGGPWAPITWAAPNSGRYQWRLPPNLPTSNDAYLRFSLGDAAAVTPAPFTISGAPPVVALTPWGGALLAVLLILAASLGTRPRARFFLDSIRRRG